MHRYTGICLNPLLRHDCPGNQDMIFMSRMFKVEAWVLLYLFKFRIQIIKMSNVAGISKYLTTLNIFSIQKRRGNGNIQSFRIVGVIRQKLKTMALMVKIDNLLLFKVVKVYISYFIFKMFSKYINKATSCRY